MSGVLGLLDIAGPIINKVLDFIPDPAQKAAAQAQAAQQLLEAASKSDLAQNAVNQNEAQSNDWFVAGWRPAIGWVCALALAFQYIVRPICPAIAAAMHWSVPPLPGLDDNLWQLMLGMLGMGSLRTIEKVKASSK